MSNEHELSPASSISPADVTPTAGTPNVGDDLPPVQPPSAAFVFQLFVIPALIVLAVVGVWALFGQMATTETDWRALVDDLDSNNPQISQRAMFGLAQALESDRRRGEEGRQLSKDPELAARIAVRLEREFQRKATDNNSIALQVFLIRGLGQLDPSDQVLKLLVRAIEESQDAEIRKSGIVSLSQLGGQISADPAKASSLDLAPVIAGLTRLSQESDINLVRAGAFALGVYPGEESVHQLTVLSQHSDRFVAVNAAVGLVRQGKTEGYPVFYREIDQAISGNTLTPDEQIDQSNVLRNVLKAVGDLSNRWNDEQRRALESKVETLAENHPHRRIRYDAQAALLQLKNRSDSKGTASQQ